MTTNIDDTKTTRRPRTSRTPAEVGSVMAAPAPATKLDQLTALLTAPAGATLDALTAATGWQVHSVRGAMAGALKKRGLVVTSDKVDGVRTYHASLA